MRHNSSVQYIFLSVFLIVCFGTSAQINIDSLSKESPYGPFTTQYFTEKQVKFNDTVLQFLDTLPDNFQRFDQVSLSNYRYQSLGNLGNSLWSVFYKSPDIIGRKSGFNSYDPYFKSREKVRYFNTKSPYSSVKAVFGGEGRAVVDVQFSRNIDAFWNVGFDVTTINADKQINSSGEGDRNTISWAYNFYTSFKTPDDKYHLLTNFSRIRHRVNESGGIVPPEIDPTSNLFGYNDDAKIWLSNAQSSELFVNYHIYHQYKLNELFQIYHVLDRSSENNKFEDTNLGVDGDFFDGFLIDESSTFDQSKLKIFQNELGVKGNVKHLFYSFYVKRRSLQYIPKYLPTNKIENENYGGTKLSYGLGPKTKVNFSGEFLTGGNFMVDGSFESPWLDAGFKSRKYLPSYLVSDYFGNHYEWHNTFPSTFSQSFDGRLKFKLGAFELFPSASFTTIDDYIYFNTNKLPERAEGNISILSPGVDLNLTFLKYLHFNNNLTYTTIEGDAADKIRIPEIHVNSKLYFENLIFDKVMWAQIGLDMHWQSSYFAMDYDPVTQQFFLQNDFEIPSYLIADLFISFKVKRVRWFFKMTNVLQNIEAEGYFATPYYTGQKRILDFGINWMFFD